MRNPALRECGSQNNYFLESDPILKINSICMKGTQCNLGFTKGLFNMNYMGQVSRDVL